MMRRVLTILVFLLLGAIVNVAVGWTLALSVNARQHPIGSVTVRHADQDWMTWKHSSFGSKHFICIDGSVGDAPIAADQLDPEWKALRTAMFNYNATWAADVRGWPMLALWCERLKHASVNPQFSGGLAPALPKFSDGWERVLPLRP